MKGKKYKTGSLSFTFSCYYRILSRKIQTKILPYLSQVEVLTAKVKPSVASIIAFCTILWIRRMINNKWQKKRKHQSLSLSVPLSLSLSSFQSIECKSEERQKIHFDEKEKSALLFYVYVRSPIDNYENKEQTSNVVDIHFVCSFCLFSMTIL